MLKTIQVAIDGPASAGKSTVAKILAKKNGYIYCDTGAMYRAVTLSALNQELSLEDETAILEMLRHLTLHFEYVGDEQHVYMNGVDVTHAIRMPNVTQNVSQVAAMPKVREELVNRQKAISNDCSIVMDGRDIGTVVLPQADLKIFLVASVEERAERRYKENKAKGIETSLEELKSEIAARDHYDSTRKVSPLMQAHDAILVDTTGKNIEEVVQTIETHLNQINS